MKEIELSMSQKFMIGIFGTSQYSVSFGRFLDTTNSQIMDYKYQRGGDPFLFMPPMEAYQLRDSTFPTFKGYLESHYVHQFNGFLTSKVPLINKTHESYSTREYFSIRHQRLVKLLHKRNKLKIHNA